MDNSNRNIVIILVSIAAIIILVFCYFLFFTTNKVEDDNYPKVEIYKYEIASNSYKYYIEKLDANRIALKDTIKYKCINEDCSKAKSLFAEGNIYKDYALIKDENLIIFDFIKSEKITINEITDFDYVNFINDGKYVLIANNDFYRVFNIDNQSLSESFKSDVLVTKDDKLFIILDKYIVNIDNGKYGIVNMETGNNIYDNEYDYIDCHSNYCLFTSKGKSTVYDISKEDDNVLVQSSNKIIYNDDNYIVYVLDGEVHLLNVGSLEDTTLSLKDNIKVEYLTDKIINYSDNNKCYNYVLKDDSKKSTECNTKSYTTDIFVDSESKTGITAKETGLDKKSYDLIVGNNKLYDNSGVYYDYIALKSEDSKIDSKYIVNVSGDNAYYFLKSLSAKIGLSSFEKMTFINRWLPVFAKNNDSYVELSFIENYDNIPGIQILTKSDNYKGMILKIYKGSKNDASTIEEVITEPIKRSGYMVVSLTGISY